MNLKKKTKRRIRKIRDQREAEAQRLAERYRNPRRLCKLVLALIDKPHPN